MFFVTRQGSGCWDEGTVRDDQALSKESLGAEFLESANDLNIRLSVGISKRRC